MMPIAQDFVNKSQLFSFTIFYWDEAEFNLWQAVGYLLLKLNLRSEIDCIQYLDLLERYVTEIHRVEMNHFIKCSKKVMGKGNNRITTPESESSHITEELMATLLADLDDLNSLRNEVLNQLLNLSELQILSHFEEIKSLQNASNHLDTKQSIIGLSNPIVRKRKLNELVDKVLANEGSIL